MAVALVGGGCRLLYLYSLITYIALATQLLLCARPLHTLRLISVSDCTSVYRITSTTSNCGMAGRNTTHDVCLSMILMLT